MAAQHREMLYTLGKQCRQKPPCSVHPSRPLPPKLELAACAHGVRCMNRVDRDRYFSHRGARLCILIWTSARARSA